jgi:membrane associated rhomboid family serine protease
MTMDCAPGFHPQEWLDECTRKRAGGFVFRGPWLTALLLGVFIAVYALELRLAVVPTRGFDPRIETLIALGGLNRQLVMGGEWYRMLTAPFLHGSVLHIVSNGIAFALAGYGLEWMVGRAWLVTLFVLGALAGSVMSMALNAPDAVSVGASGGIMALVAALMMLAFRLPPGRLRKWTLIHTARTIIPAVIPHLSAGPMRIDYGAHIGGAAVGVALGCVLWLTWRSDVRLPPFRALACTVAWLAAGAVGAGGWQAAARYPHVPRIFEVSDASPFAAFPRTPAEFLARVRDLLAEARTAAAPPADARPMVRRDSPAPARK